MSQKRGKRKPMHMHVSDSTKKNALQFQAIIGRHLFISNVKAAMFDFSRQQWLKKGFGQ
jgi:hypothetical protein